jgi:Tol biopolymer transport system component
MKRIFLFTFCSLMGCTLFAQQRNSVTSMLEVLDVTSGKRTVVKEFPFQIEAPNWTPDGKWLVYNSGGKLYMLSPDQPAEPQLIHSAFAIRCNNDHLITRDGKQIAISHGTKEDGRSRVYTMPFTGGTPRLITPLAPSYLHGWSPDNKYLAYCAERNGNFDVYIIPAEGGEEIRLTTSAALDDGPEYSPDGQYIWFNSARSGLMQAWRMKADGTEQTQMTFDETVNAWFPHVSPDGQQVIFITYKKNDLLPSEHLANKNVELRLMPASGGQPRTMAELFGGQGSINVNSWAPDSKRLAFVSYRLNEENLFEGSGDVGKPKKRGSMKFDPQTGAYTLSGGGTNMWLKSDEFFTAWRKESGNFSLSAKIEFEGEGVDPHRKVGIIIRQSLDKDSKYADIAVHGDGLTSLQYRGNTGEETKEVVAENKHANFITLERVGNKIITKTATGHYTQEVTGEIELDFSGPCYIGLFICSHNPKVIETARFSEVRFRK